MKYACLCVLLVSHLAHADDWLCKSQATERVGNSFHSCGVARAADENDARLAAFENAKKEFSAICQASDDCTGRFVLVNPGRTDCAPDGTGVKCYRAVVFSVEGEVKSPSGRIEPYRGKKPSTPAIAKGMTKAQLLEKFGTPQQIIENNIGDWHSLHLIYRGPMCVYPGLPCSVIAEHGVVKSYSDVKPEYTDLMN